MPTLFVTNTTGMPLEIVAYDYTVPVQGVQGIFTSPEFDLGVVSADSGCLTLASLAVGDEFAIVGEDKQTGANTPATGTFVPQDASGWMITFANFATTPIGPLEVSKPCSPP